MCPPKAPKIEKADPVAPPPPPPADAPKAPVMNDPDVLANKDAQITSTARRGRSSLTIPLRSGGSGVNIPR